MKWLITVPRYLPEKVGGNFIYVNQFSEQLAHKGADVHVLTTTLKKELPPLEVVNGVTIHRVYVEKGNMGPAWFKYTKKVTDYITQLDKKERFDCINLHAAFMVNTKKLRKDLKIVYTLHAVVTYEYLFKLKKHIQNDLLSVTTFKELIKSPLLLPLSFFREWIDVSRADEIVVMSNYVKGTIKRFLPGININKVFISRIGIDTTFKPSKNKEELKREMGIKNQTSLLTVRRLESRMGVDNLINALSILKKQNKLSGVKLFIAGKGSLKSYFEDLISAKKLTENVTLLGFVTDDELRKWYQVVDAFVMPTEELEGFGIVTIEAFASNLPVIATPAGANPEVAGKYCPDLLAKSQKCPSDMADAISSYLENQQAYKSINYEEQAKKDFNWSDIIDEIVDQTKLSEK